MGKDCQMSDVDADKKLAADKQRAWQAKELLGNELLQESLMALQTEIIKQWEAAPARDVEGKEHLWQLYKVAIKFKSVLTGYVQAGDFADAQLQQKQSVLDKALKVVKNYR
jgi:hypothetical protein